MLGMVMGHNTVPSRMLEWYRWGFSTSCVAYIRLPLGIGGDGGALHGHPRPSLGGFGRVYGYLVGGLVAVG